MKKRFGIVLLLLYSFCFFNMPAVSGQESSYIHVTIYGDPHYFFEPSNAPIQQEGNVFTLTGDVDSLTFMSDNSVLDGNGYTVTGENCSTFAVAIAASHITVKNLVVSNGAEVGISVGGYNCTVTNCIVTGITVREPRSTQTAAIFIWAGDNHTITGNQIKFNSVGIAGYYSSKNMVFANNNVTGNVYGITLQGCYNNTLFNNVFNNTQNWYSVSADLVNFWDNGAVGNYWSNYNGTDHNSDGIGDLPYVINENNQDNYPLMNPAEVEAIPEFSVWPVLPLFFVGTLFALFVKKQ